MRYIKTYENFKPIKVNNAKPFKVKKNIDTSIQFLQRRIKSLRNRLETGKNYHNRKHSDMNKDKNDKIKQLGELTFKKIKQNAYLNSVVKERNFYRYGDDEEEEGENLIDVFSFDARNSPDFKPEIILDYIGLDEDEYKIPKEYEPYGDYKYDKKGFTILMSSKDLADLMDNESDDIERVLSLTSYYSQYEYYVDDSDLDYINFYLNPEIINDIKDLADLFNYDLDIVDEENEGNIRKFFDYLGLDKKLKDFKNEIAMENERAVEKAAKELLNSLPFRLSNEYSSSKFNLELKFDYNDMIEYMNKHDLKDIKTIKKLLEHIYEADEFEFSKLEQETKHEYLGDFKDLKNSVKDAVDEYFNSPDNVFPFIIQHDNLEAFKNNMELANFVSIYTIPETYRNRSDRHNLFEIAKHFNGKILGWFDSNDFRNRMKERTKEEIEEYEEFSMKQGAEKYNII